MTTTSVHNLYKILNLPEPSQEQSSEISRDDLKVAYHRALLLHHPDKAIRHFGTSDPILHRPGDNTAKYSIDEIVHAYRLLSDSTSRRQYDSQLIASRKPESSVLVSNATYATHLGIEAFDLDDLQYNEKDGSWYKTCRCGNETGYLVTEKALEQEADMGELYVGCHGCSLFIKVLFGVAAEEEDLVQDIA